ncbi:sericin-1-like [Oncorhynchus masou masou]|uniref:sericin-1-like n=1 Tax=Oncorhynchus masou masou TaxID=90313 RepID=UPI003182EDF5
MTSDPGSATGSHASARSPGSPASAGSSGSHASAGSSGFHAFAGSPGSPASAGLSGSHASAGTFPSISRGGQSTPDPSDRPFGWRPVAGPERAGEGAPESATPLSKGHHQASGTMKTKELSKQIMDKVVKIPTDKSVFGRRKEKATCPNG